MSGFSKTLEIRTSPHILSGYGVDQIMFNVVLALVPVAMFAVYAFGLAALLTLTVAVASCVATEHWVSKRAGGRSTVGDWSITITGLLYGLTNDLDWETTGRLASLMGALKIECHGTQNHRFSRADLEARYLESFGRSL